MYIYIERERERERCLHVLQSRSKLLSGLHSIGTPIGMHIFNRDALCWHRLSKDTRPWTAGQICIITCTSSWAPEGDRLETTDGSTNRSASILFPIENEGCKATPLEHHACEMDSKLPAFYAFPAGSCYCPMSHQINPMGV